MTKSTPKTTASEKTVAKAPISKKPVAQKATAKTRATKTASVKAKTTQAKTTPVKNDFQKTIASLEARMKRADTLTRKSVKALESTVMTLDARTRKDNSTSKAALTRKVNQLSAKLTDMISQTQADVNSELKTVLNNPTVETLQAALTRADHRMSHAEQAQAEAISKVNRHLSAIATAVETRIDEEAKARKAAISALKADTQNGQTALTHRIDLIEKDAAQALSHVGEKITELSDELTRRGKASEISIREKVSEVALKTQAEFESYRAGLERRIDDVAQDASSNDTQQLERTIAGLTARLEGLEYTIANAPPAIIPQNSDSLSHMPDEHMTTPPMSPAPQLSIVSGANLQDPIPAIPAMAQDYSMSAPDAFTAMTELPTAQQNAVPNPYLAAQTPAAPLKVETHVPVEYNPQNFQQQAQPQRQLELQTESQIQPPARDFIDAREMPVPPPPADLNALPPIASEHQALPYSDPAYAENDPTMDRMRIGGNTSAKISRPKLTGRNMRVAALATGVAVLGLVAVKGVFSGNDSNVTPQRIAERIESAGNGAPVSIPKPDTSGAPIGEYKDNKAVTVAIGSEAAKTLNSAAAAGDAIAQFQLGLSYLEQGRTDEGVALIRKSANQNQPAAQYRLAKLYEIGQGVSQDSEMARQLTERAATNGNRIAMHDLALYYAEGRGGVKADLPTAAKWFEKAAERGVVDSQFNLGVLFESGQGLPKNVNDAFVWYSIAAAQGDQFAKTRVDVLTATLDQADLLASASRIKQFKPRKIDEAANGIFRNVAWSKPKSNIGEKVSQVKQVQTLLSDLGYDIGGADGSVGPKTRAAIMSFERANSLPETGRVNTALIDRLELAAGA